MSDSDRRQPSEAAVTETRPRVRGARGPRAGLAGPAGTVRAPPGPGASPGSAPSSPAHRPRTPACHCVSRDFLLVCSADTGKRETLSKRAVMSKASASPFPPSAVSPELCRRPSAGGPRLSTLSLLVLSSEETGLETQRRFKDFLPGAIDLHTPRAVGALESGLGRVGMCRTTQGPQEKLVGLRNWNWCGLPPLGEVFRFHILGNHLGSLLSRQPAPGLGATSLQSDLLGETLATDLDLLPLCPCRKHWVL
ncbi:uncharacterized protein LOC124990851 [Sciurus carolinensis]|uniref:uncharacterized protein LOC124990851 n=1 Tax=Sciurus carolinensis TaxID=30640 RepID=UPI001FB1C40E|nr:uncharacterized protein LOC124990851 [Sciurus carolinensis]